MEHVGAGVPDDPGPPRRRGSGRCARGRSTCCAGLLPAATTANVGIYASGQAYEAMLIRMAAHPLPEARECARAMLAELRTVIPAFLTRVDRVDRGVATGEYLAEGERTAAALAGNASALDPPSGAEEPGVRLIDFDPDGEARVLAHALWPSSGGSLADLRARVAGLTPGRRAEALREWAGQRGDRRQRPGRALEATTYTFEVVCDYGAYRDLQRHRMLTLQAQPLGPRLGYAIPDEVAAAGAADDYAADPAPLRRAARRARARVRGGGALRRHAGPPHPLHDDPERARGDAPDRAAQPAPGPRVVPRRRPRDAPRRSPRRPAIARSPR